ncbi:hypothetical protein [Candidatus Leptofilum sp.]|uniref:hypothetical protein n=1 Tax=Candidatus Leptofilum sp. TaxID=3241576 RepID=UPI003B5CF85C
MKNAVNNRLIDGIISIVEMLFPERVRAYYLTGSYAEGAAVRQQLRTLIEKTPSFENLILERGKSVSNQQEN